MVHLKVDKWSTCWLKFLKAAVDHLLTQSFCFNFVFFCGKNPFPPCSLHFWCFGVSFGGLGGPPIDLGGGQMWTTYRPYSLCIYEQRHFYANKAKTERHHFCLKLSKTKCTPVERDRKLPARNVQGMVSSRTRSERDNLRHEGTRQVACQYKQGFFLLECQMSKNTSKTKCTPERRDWNDFLKSISATPSFCIYVYIYIYLSLSLSPSLPLSLPPSFPPLRCQGPGRAGRRFAWWAEVSNTHCAWCCPSRVGSREGSLMALQLPSGSPTFWSLVFVTLPWETTGQLQRSKTPQCRNLAPFRKLPTGPPDPQSPKPPQQQKQDSKSPRIFEKLLE